MINVLSTVPSISSSLLLAFITVQKAKSFPFPCQKISTQCIFLPFQVLIKVEEMFSAEIFFCHMEEMGSKLHFRSYERKLELVEIGIQ